VLPALLSVVFVDTLGYAIVVPIIPFALLGHGVSPAAVGAVFAIFSLSQFLTAPLLGRLSDRIGRRPVLALSQAGSALGFAILAASSSYIAVLLSRLIDGASAGNLAVCYAAVIDSEDEVDRKRGIPALAAATGAGILVGLGICTFLARYGLGAAAGAALLFSLLSLSLTALLVPETGRVRHTDLSVRRALQSRPLRRGSAFVVLCAALQAGFFLTLPAYLAGRLGLHAQGTTALIASLVALAAAFQFWLLPHLLERLHSRASARALIIASLAGAAVLALGFGPVPELVAAGILAIAAASLSPVSALLLAEGRPGAPMGLVMGLNASSATAGQIVGPIAGYAALGLTGPRGLGLSCLALGLCAAASAGMLERG
jgi:MFS family permease